MAGSLLACGYLALFAAAGFALARRTLPQAALGTVLPLGCCCTVALLATLPALFAVGLGFTLPAVAAAGGAAAGILGLCLFAAHRCALPPLRAGRALGPLLACVLPLFALSCVLLYTHILRPENGGYTTGQSCYGDLPMHLAFIKSIAVRGAFPPVYPLLGGSHSFGYPYLCETVSSVFLLLGAPLRLSVILPMLPAFLSVYGMAWQLARRILGRAGKASLAFWLFFMGSGFGFFYFLQSSAAFRSIFTSFYHTPTNDTDLNLRWVNPVIDLLLPQRATLFGWALLFPALYLLWRFCMEGERRLWLPLALIALPLPLIHAHSALALAVISLVCGVYTLLTRPRKLAVLGPWLSYAALCAAVWLAIAGGTVLAQAAGGEHMLRLHFNWINNQGGTLTDPYFWFYIKNIGVVYLLAIPAFLHANRRQRWFYGGGLALLALAEFVVFQPNTYDNNKLLFVWHLLGCVLAANLIWDALAALRSRAVRGVLAAAILFLATFGSVLSMGRELVSRYDQWSAEDIALAEYVDANAAPDALFLTSDSHLQPVSDLAGRQILCGSGAYVYYHGMNYAAEAAAQRALYLTPDSAELAAWGVDYVVYDPTLSAEFAAGESWYAARYPLWYQSENCRVYRIAPAA